MTLIKKKKTYLLYNRKQYTKAINCRIKINNNGHYQNNDTKLNQL